MKMRRQVLKRCLFTALPVVVVFGCGGVHGETLAASQIPTVGLVAYYPFSGNTNDASGNGFHCTPHGAVLTSDRTRRPNSAYSFNGVDAYIECPTSPRLGVRAGVDMTVSVWVRPLARDAERGIISKYLHFFPEVCDFYVSIQTPDVGAITRITAQGFDGLDGDAPKQGVWSHMSVVFRGTQGNATLYINGKAIGTAPLTFNPEPGPLPLRIGVTRGGDHLGVFKGGIDDVRIYERALTPTEVKALALESDSDGDGTPDHEDECLDSDLRATVVIDGCNSGVPSTVFPSGCTISDLIAACAEGASNHGQFVSCVSHLTNDLKKTGTISGQQKGAIQSCAAQAGSE